MELKDIKKSIKEIEQQLEKESISPAVGASLKLLFNMVEILILLIEKLPTQKLTSKNSSIPPSQDPNRSKESRKKKGKKRGGQKGRKGRSLKQVDNPDEIIEIPVDPSTLPDGEFKEDGYIRRQVVEIEVIRKVIEYQAQVLIDKNGKKHIAPFPDGVIAPAQYGNSVRSHSVYLSQFQLLPVKRIEEYFENLLGFPLSSGSIHNFNQLAYDKLARFEQIAKAQLINSDLVHADETGINIDGKRLWLHSTSNLRWTLFYPHEKRGMVAIDEMGVIPEFQGILVHDHWKPYFNYGCKHSICNAHILRELEAALERDGNEQSWIGKIKNLLIKIYQETTKLGSILPAKEAEKYWREYEDVLKEAQKECPEPPPHPPPPPGKKKKRGRVARSKTRNLLERLMEYKVETLRFMEDRRVPFTNNLGEKDIRMTKVQQKISGCFRSMDGAKTFCRVRSYLSTCQKNGVNPADALALIFEGRLPEFLERLETSPD